MEVVPLRCENPADAGHVMIRFIEITPRRSDQSRVRHRIVGHAETSDNFVRSQ